LTKNNHQEHTTLGPVLVTDSSVRRLLARDGWIRYPES
jgi:hypothetical protein